jgi:hypothetical protein
VAGPEAVQDLVNIRLGQTEGVCDSIAEMRDRREKRGSLDAAGRSDYQQAAIPPYSGPVGSLFNLFP